MAVDDRKNKGRNRQENARNERDADASGKSGENASYHGMESIWAADFFNACQQEDRIRVGGYHVPAGNSVLVFSGLFVWDTPLSDGRFSGRGRRAGCDGLYSGKGMPSLCAGMRQTA